MNNGETSKNWFPRIILINYKKYGSINQFSLMLGGMIKS